MKTAELACIENLLNCYCREVATHEGQVRFTQHELAPSVIIKLPATGREIEAPARLRSLTGSIELLGPCKGLDWRAVAQLLIAEVGASNQCEPHPELLSLIEDSLNVTRAILEHDMSCDTKAMDFISSEQSLLFGHPFHPSPKSRLGFSGEQLGKYSPELGAHFPLHYFAVREDLVEQSSLMEEQSSLVEEQGSTVGISCTELVQRQAHDVTPPSGYGLVPLHPWQAEFVKSYSLVRQALESGELIDLGKGGPGYFATSSVRTLYAPGAPYFLKTALNMRITNCLRRNSPHELASSLEVSRWMREIRPALTARYPQFVALDEPAYLTVRLPGTNPGEREQSDRVAESFGLMLRESAPIEADSTVQPLVAAALFGNRERGRLQLQNLFGTADREAWFARYLSLAVPPLLELFFDYGLMFEPHLQNLLLGVRDGQVARIFLRDFDNGKVITDWFPTAKLAPLPAVVRDELLYSADVAWKRFTYCLVVNNLAEAAAMVAGGDLALESRLWRLVHDEFLAACETLANPRARSFIHGLLDSDMLPAKGNFITRVFKRPDRKAGYFPVANPMAVFHRHYALPGLEAAY